VPCAFVDASKRAISSLVYFELFKRQPNSAGGGKMPCRRRSSVSPVISLLRGSIHVSVQRSRVTVTVPFAAAGVSLPSFATTAIVNLSPGRATRREGVRSTK